MIPSIQIVFFLILLAACLRAEPAIRDTVSSLSTRVWQRRGDALPENYHFVAPRRGSNTLPAAVDDVALLDVVILASVDGKLHGLNRTTGRLLWSMSDDPKSPRAGPVAFDPLVRTQHSSHEDPDQELFIIEPQSGDIYVLPPMASPSDSLQPLSFSMPQLVEMSPFSFPGDEHRVFVGRKETSMVVIELDTGRVKGTVKADTECFWDDERVLAEDIDLDELDGTKPPKRTLQSHEVHIGRTDYHVRVHLRHQGVIQNLHYSSYGPNNIDKERQSQWKRTPDDLYVQPLPNGQVLAFQTDSPEDAQKPSKDGMPIWAREFNEPIVAIFDVLSLPSRPNPLALLQPRPHLEHLFPSGSKGRLAHSLPEITYVGLVGDSLYAMGHEHFPLVVFEQHRPPARVEATDAEVSSTDVCRGRRCLVGSRKIETSAQWYLPPLLDAVPHVPGLAQERVSFEPRIESGHVDPDADANDSHAGIGEVERERWTSKEAGTWGTLGAVVIMLVLFGKAFLGKRRGHIIVAADPSPKDDVTVAQVEKTSTPEALQTSSPTPSPIIPTVQLEASPEATHVPLTPKLIPQIPYLPTLPLDTVEPEDGDESDKEGALDTPRRRGPRRRKRGKKKKTENAGQVEEDEGVLKDAKDIANETEVRPLAPTIPMTPIIPVPAPPPSSLLVSDTVLGFGSHGTVVYEGSLQGRAVAVKRLLQDFVTIAAREVELLQESDDHPNVIRYFYKEAKDGFLYIALELCPASLADIIERPDAFAIIAGAFDPKRALAQIAAGLRHLHTLKIVHRDIKPQNILVSRAKNGQHRMLISDFGLCKKLEVDQSSFLPTMAAGTVGWRAPEILRGEVKLDEQPMDPDDSSRGSTASARTSSSKGGQPTRLTRSVDVFALGCLFYYTLTSGSHPFGDRFEREVNILKGRVNLTGLEHFGEEGVEAVHLISKMLDQDAKARPDTTTCLTHPFFWTPERRLNFLQDASDRFEIMCRDPREASLVTLETGAYDVVGNDWHSRLDKVFVDNLGKFRKYDGRSVQDLLRALRNKKHHYQDMPEHVKRHLGPLPEGFLGYFTRRFPALFLHVHGVVWRCGLARESMFRSYFELADP